MNKADYVRSARQTRDHSCHWPGCDTQVPPAMWGCRPHWGKLPKRLRNLIWSCYEIGQEESLAVSAAYLAAAHEVQQWIADNTRAKVGTDTQEQLQL